MPCRTTRTPAHQRSLQTHGYRRSLVWLNRYSILEEARHIAGVQFAAAVLAPMLRPSNEHHVLTDSFPGPVEAWPVSASRRRIRLAVYSRLSSLDHPYFRLMHQALERRGIAISGSVEIRGAWLRANRGRIDAVHFHWPETTWSDARWGRRHAVVRAARSARGLLRVYRFLREARRLGITRVWTIHNLEPHEGPSMWDRLGYRLFARCADIVVSHSTSSLKEVERRYGGTARMVVMPMGTLNSAFPAPRSRQVVMSELGLDPRLPMVSCIGRLRAYKGLDIACAAVERLNGQVQFVAAGVPHPDSTSNGFRIRSGAYRVRCYWLESLLTRSSQTSRPRAMPCCYPTARSPAVPCC